MSPLQNSASTCNVYDRLQYRDCKSLISLFTACTALQAVRRQSASPMQPSHQPHSAEQSVKPTHIRFGMDALENMIDMGRAMPSASAAASRAGMPAAYAAAAHQLPAPQQSHHPIAAPVASVNARINVVESKKIKLDSDGLIAMESSRAVSAELPAAAQRCPPDLGSAPASDFAQQSFSLQSQRLKGDFASPSGSALGGTALHVEEDRNPVTPSLLTGSAARSTAYPQERQDFVDRASRWVPLPATPGGSSSAQHQGFVDGRRLSSGRGQVISKMHVVCLAVELAEQVFACIQHALAACAGCV